MPSLKKATRIDRAKRKQRVQDQRRTIDVSLGHPVAAQFQLAVLEARWTDAGRLFTRLEDWNDRNLLISTVADTPGRPDQLERWVWEQPGNPLALLVRGAHSVRWAWQVREEGGGDDDLPRFFERLRAAEEDLHAVTQMAPEDPLSWSWLIRSGRGLKIPTEELGMRFRQCRKREAGLWHAHHQLLMSLSARAGGSDEAALQFARLASEQAPNGAPIHDLVAIAHLEVWMNKGRPPTSMYFFAQIADEVVDAARRSVLHEDFAAVAAYAPAIRSLNAFALTCHLSGAHQQAGKLLQVIGNRVTGFPWNYAGQHPITAHAEVVAAVNKHLLRSI